MQTRSTNQPSDDSVTLGRFEAKFELSEVDVQKLVQILSMNCAPVVHTNTVSKVSSVYFDDDLFTSCRENIDGIGVRKKLRLRWYDSVQPEGFATFEVKSRENHFIRKERYPIRIPRELDEMPHDALVNCLMEQLPRTVGLLLYQRGLPAVLVRYRRRHFRSRTSPVQCRVTLDEQIECLSQRNSTHLVIDDSPSLKLGRQVVLEAKVPIGFESEIPLILYPLRLRQSKFSKYVKCCATAGLHSLAN